MSDSSGSLSVSETYEGGRRWGKLYDEESYLGKERGRKEGLVNVCRERQFCSLSCFTISEEFV